MNRTEIMSDFSGINSNFRTLSKLGFEKTSITALKQFFLFWMGQSKGKKPLSILGPWLLLGDIVYCRILINRPIIR
jgi:hypothetical protein